MPLGAGSRHWRTNLPIHGDRATATIELLYGRGTLTLSPPPGCVPAVIRKSAMPVLADSRTAVERALATPVASPPAAWPS